MVVDSVLHLLKLLVLTSLLFGSSDAVRPSPGCANNSNGGLGSGLQPGQYEDFERELPGTQRSTHRLYKPSNYGTQGPSPVILYFHGWGGDHTSCGTECSEKAVDKGFVTVTMSGYANSWKHGGSTGGSRAPISSIFGEAPACAANTQGFCQDYQSSGCDCSDEGSHCGWTTCYDSVEQAMAVLDDVQNNLCVDLDQIWAMGCSNGGMFTFELARDDRSAPRLKGIVPLVGLPHNGYSEGPLLQNIKMFGMWGRTDDVVPPISNTNDPNKSTDQDGWYYTVSDKVMSDWTEGKGCIGDGQDPIGSDDWGISNYSNKLTCTQGCSEREDDRIVGCIFEGGHDCYREFMWEPIFNYMLENECVAGPTLSLAKPSVSPGESIEVSYTTSEVPRSDDWVAILPANTDIVNGVVNWDDVLEWAYICGSKDIVDCQRTTTGSISLASGGLAEGSYIVYYLCCDDYNVNGQSEPFVVSSSGPNPTANPTAAPVQAPALSLARASFAPGENIEVSYTTSDVPRSDDWVAILPHNMDIVNGVVNWDDVLEWAYICGSKDIVDCQRTTTGSTNLASNCLADGTYIVYYLCCNDYNVNGQSEPFVISSAPSPTAAPVQAPALSLAKRYVAPGENIVVSYTTSNIPNPEDWLAIIPKSAQIVDGVVNWDDVVEWAYICGSKDLGVCQNNQNQLTTTGSVTLASDGLADGKYFVYYLCCDDYNVNGRSRRLVVQTNPSQLEHRGSQ